jgi:hypothetical protein
LRLVRQAGAYQECREDQRAAIGCATASADGEKKYTQAIEATGKAEQTLTNAKWVASKIDFSRRREKLKWGIHAEVASLPIAQADAIFDKAEHEGWTVHETRRRVNQAKASATLIAAGAV